ncbi:TPA: hypothetical protein ENS27_07900 [bacterium]|mgnify:CR=1 FL=1|nr:hypothetical protein [bacterium]
MSKCQICGKDAGFFRSAHKECKQKYEEGSNHIISMATQSAITQSDLSELQQALNKTISVSYIDSESLRYLLITAWEQAVSKVLNDSILSESEEINLLNFLRYFKLTIDDVDKNGAYTRVIKSSIIREILDGKIPKRFHVDGLLPFNFQKNETLIWLFQNVPYYEPRTRTTYYGSSSGVSLKIAKGVYYRVGGFRGNPVVKTETVLIDIGILAITDKHVYFAGNAKSFRIQYNKIVSFTSYSDGIAIHRDSASAKPQVFITGDGWFTYNLMTNLANLQIQS